MSIRFQVTCRHLSSLVSQLSAMIQSNRAQNTKHNTVMQTISLSFRSTEENSPAFLPKNKYRCSADVCAEWACCRSSGRNRVGREEACRERGGSGFVPRNHSIVLETSHPRLVAFPSDGSGRLSVKLFMPSWRAPST